MSEIWPTSEEKADRGSTERSPEAGTYNLIRVHPFFIDEVLLLDLWRSTMDTRRKSIRDTQNTRHPLWYV